METQIFSVWTRSDALPTPAEIRERIAPALVAALRAQLPAAAVVKPLRLPGPELGVPFAETVDGCRVLAFEMCDETIDAAGFVVRADLLYEF